MMAQLATLGDYISGTTIILLVAAVTAALAILFRKRIKRWFK